MFSYERRRETKPAFKGGMCDLRNGCCGCFIPYFPLQTIPRTSGNKWNAIWSLSNITLYTYPHWEAHKHVSQIAALPERNIFRDNNSLCSFEMCWQLIGRTRWLSCISPAVILLCYVKASYCTLMQGFLFLLFPVSLNGPINTFQMAQLSTGAFVNEKNIFYSMQECRIKSYDSPLSTAQKLNLKFNANNVFRSQVKCLQYGL